MFVNKAISITQTEMRGIRTVFNPPWRRSISGKYDIVHPYEVTAEKTVPPDIEKPEYFASSVPEVVYATETKSAVAIDKMRLSCQLAKKVLNAAIPLLKVGVTTDFIDGKLHQMIIENGAYPSPLRYHGFPKSICTSVNNVICHGIPDLRPLRDGDIINVDVTVFRGGYHGDCSATFLVGNVDEEGIHLVEGAKKCLLKGIGACGPGERFSAIAIEEEAHKQRLNVVPNVLGHGIGSYFHGPPDIYHIYNDFGGVMLPGMTFTIEPALTNGSVGTCVLEDGWTCVSVDHARSAQFEETVLIKADGVEVLT
ncbi:methionine aminopeptidase 1D, mitochondrial isoform X2 [Schistocerca piceifrons]|uniref:methionine aminopeptidase 1D, mitochondrial isoform X2 n=1 Tax=Schistocerca piceifrons TaxID=274613 RepID=UPI001F5F16D6|nr:methionine aminopeptidase 1D, mitochondrial isoform X2 [Schistocerca piceifrons]